MTKKLLSLSIFMLISLTYVNAQIFSEDFENGQGNWIFTDIDQDGYNWSISNAGSLNPIYGSGSIVSWSYIDNVGVLQPDNLATSPSISIPATSNNAYLKFTYETQSGYPNEKYSIYVTTSNNSTTIIGSTPVYTETVTTGGTPVERVIDLSSYIGQNVYLSFRHYDCQDEYYLIIDNISIEELDNEDAEMLFISTPSTVASGNVDIEGEILNKGAQNITSLELNWQVDGGTTYTQTLNGLNVSLNSSYQFTHPDQWNATPGAHNLDVWVSSVNGVSITNSQSTTLLSKTIEVATGSTTKTPIFERFTSATCVPCASFNTNSFNGFYNQRHDDFVYIAYHMNYPGSGDPYYQQEATIRHTYYGVGGVPSLFINGQEFVLAGSYNSITQRLYDDLDTEMTADAFMEFTNTSATLSGNTVTLNLDIMPYLNGQYNIFAAVIEHETTGNVPATGGNGETEFTDMMMKMISDPNGESTSFTANTAYQTTLTTDLSNTYIEEMNDIEIVAFIQDPSSQEILQAINVPFGTLATEKFSEQEINIYPNPTKLGYINIDIKEEATASIYDLSGRVIKNNTKLNNGNNRINTGELSSGVYLIKVQANNKAFTQKIVIQ